MKKTLKIAILAALLATFGSASAKTGNGNSGNGGGNGGGNNGGNNTPTLDICGAGDLGGVTVSKCAGFFSGNLISNNPSSTAQVKSILSSTFNVANSTAVWSEKIDLAGSKTVNFSTLLKGDVIVAIHYGNGVGGPGNGTAFYELVAGSSGLDTFTTKFSASSDAAIYYMNAPVVAAVPDQTDENAYDINLRAVPAAPPATTAAPTATATK